MKEHDFTEKLTAPDSELTQADRNKIEAIIEQELLQSSQFGLQLTQEERAREVAAVCRAVAEHIHHFDGWVSQETYRVLFAQITQSIREELADLVVHYFRFFSEQGKTRTTYNIHLESVVAAVLSYVDNT